MRPSGDGFVVAQDAFALSLCAFATGVPALPWRMLGASVANVKLGKKQLPAAAAMLSSTATKLGSRVAVQWSRESRKQHENENALRTGTVCGTPAQGSQHGDLHWDRLLPWTDLRTWLRVLIGLTHLAFSHADQQPHDEKPCGSFVLPS